MEPYSAAGLVGKCNFYHEWSCTQEKFSSSTINGKRENIEKTGRLCTPFLKGKAEIRRNVLELGRPKLTIRRRQWHPTPVLLPGKSHGRRSLLGCSPWGRKESDTTERLHFHALKKELATHSIVLAWRSPGTGKPGGLLSMGSHRVGHY